MRAHHACVILGISGDPDSGMGGVAMARHLMAGVLELSLCALLFLATAISAVLAPLLV